MGALPYLDLPRVRRARGEMSLPGSKSISNRVLLLAALAEGRTEITGLLDSDDTRVMLTALRQLGVNVSELDAGRVTVEGVRRFPVESAELFMGNAGTAIRPLTAALALMGGDYKLSGVPRMHERPIGDLGDALNALGARVGYLGQPGYPPLHIGLGEIIAGAVTRVQGLGVEPVPDRLAAGRPDRSRAQRQADDDRSRRRADFQALYRDHAEPDGALRRHRAPRRLEPLRDRRRRRLPQPGPHRGRGDASTASYFLALGAIGGGPLRVSGVGADSIQGDVGFAQTLADMGASVSYGPDWIEVSGVNVADGERLKAFDTDFNLIPDAAMTAAALALYADGPCRLRNIGSWRVKETDRIHAMQTELEKLGATVESGPDWLRVTPPVRGGWRDAHIGTWDDHRMAMCFSLAAFGPAAVCILDPGCVSKTFPGYFDVYAGLVSA